MIATLSKQLVKEYKNHNLYLTAVESCTGGSLTAAITNISGASEILAQSFITYSNEAKMQLGVQKETIKKHTVYSIETAKEMAKAGFERAVKADVSIGITGSLTREDPNNPNSKVGEVYIAIYHNNHYTTKTLQLKETKDRKNSKDQIIKVSLEMLLEIIQ